MPRKDSASELKLLRDALLRPEFKCFGRNIDLYHELQDDHVEEVEMPLFTKILSALTDIIERVEKEIREHEESREFRSSQVCQPRMSFDDPDYRDDPEQWKFTVRRTDWEDFAYCIEFKGSEFDRFHAGD